MNHNQKALISLLNSSLKKQKIKQTDFKNSDWNYILSEAKEHQIHSILYSSIKQLSPEVISSELIKSWKASAINTALYFSKQIQQLDLVFQAFNDFNIPIIALKGLILRNLYPIPDFRIMGDADILVHKEDLDKIRTLLTNMGYIEAEDETPAHITFVHRNNCAIEVHWTLADNRYINDISQFEIGIWHRAATKKIRRSTVLCLCPEDFLMHLCIHMAVHMRGGGFGLRQLCDLVLLVENEIDNVDWKSFSLGIRNNGIEKFTATIFRVCNTLFNLTIPNELKAVYVENRFINALIDDIFEGGVFGMRSLDRVFGNNIVNADIIFNGEDSKKVRSVFSIIFPPSALLSNNYSYAKKNKFLLPMAWIHHFISGIFNRQYSLADKLRFIFFSNSTFRKRDTLLRNLEL